MSNVVEMNTPFGAAEQTLAFTLSYFASEVILSKEDRDMYMGILRDVQGHVDRGHPIADRLAEAADVLILAHGGNGLKSSGMSWCSAMLRVSSAVAQFSKWRAGRAQETFNIQRRKLA